MERNDGNDFGAANDTGAVNDGSTGGTSGASGYGAGGLGGSTGSTAGAGGTTGGSYGGTTGGGYADTTGGSYGTATNTSGGVGGAAGSDQLRQNAQAARERLGHAGERAREVKRNVEQTLADRLEAGARSLRGRGTASAGTPAYAAAGGATAASTDAQLDQLQGNVVKGMEATADWLRNGDLKASVEEQARTNPGRTLLVALGVGYLLGKAFRR